MSLNLSKFKKVSEDEKSAKLKHPDGHIIIVALHALSPKMKEDLKKLPKVSEPKKYAEGTPDEPVSADDEQAPSAPLDAESGITPPAQDMDNGSPAPVEDNSTPAATAQPEAPAAAPAQTDATINAAQAALPQQPVQQQQAPIPPPTPEQHGASVGQEILQEGNAFNQDLLAGHIQPKTMHDLFEDKSTLGKVGTIFGMILSGAGSGLTHQPNMLLQMMQKQIDNDLDAQKSSASNKQNLYKLNMQHQMQQADIKRMDINNQLTQAQTDATKAKTPAEVAEAKARVGQLQAQQKQLEADTNIKTDALTKIQMNRIAVHKLSQIANSTASTPQQKADAQQTLAMLANSVDNENYDVADRAAAKSALFNKISGAAGFGQTPQGQNPEGAFQNTVQTLKMTGNEKMADDLQSRHMPGIPGQASVPLTSEDRDRIQGSQALMGSLKRLQDFTNTHKNSIDPRVVNEGKALAAQVQGDFRMATHGGVFKIGEQNFIEQIIPSDPTQFVPTIRILPKLDAVMKETNARNNQFLQQKGFPVQKAAATQPAAAPDTKFYNGKYYKRGPNGESVEVK